MVSIDFYKLQDLDTSIILNYPKGMPGVTSAVIEMLNTQGKLVVDEDVTVESARELVTYATGSTSTYYMVKEANSKVWAILRDAVNEDRLRVVGVFHGELPDTLPESAVVIDVGRSMHRKVSKPTVAAINSVVGSKVVPPAGKPEEIYSGLQVLCYETLYSPEARLFPKNVSSRIPRAVAFNLMYNPPMPPTDSNFRSAIIRFLQEVKG